ncbi:hypothetical protein JCM14036_22300 [Desulfotomaculum defluvii]
MTKEKLLKEKGFGFIMKNLGQNMAWFNNMERGQKMRTILVGAILVIILLGTGCQSITAPNTTISQPQEQIPTVNIVAQVTHLSSKEYESVGTHGIKNPTIDDFRNFLFRVEIANGKDVTKKQIKVPGTQDFKNIMTRDRYWFGTVKSQNNDGEDLSFEERNSVLYYRGLTDDKLKEMLSAVEFQVSWVNKNGDVYNKGYKLKDYLIFK